MRLFAFPLALLALLVGSALPAGDSARPLHLAAASSPASKPLAMLWQGTGARVTAIDEMLTPIRPRSVPLGEVDAWAFSPAGDRLALAAHPHANLPEPDSLRLVQVRTLKLVKSSIRINGVGRALLWSRPDRIVVLLGDSQFSAIETIDPIAGRVLSTRAIDGAVVAMTRTNDSLVLLAAPENAIGIARLTIVDDDGTVRSARLDRVSAGYSWQNPSGDPIGTQRIPALIVDTADGRAYVIQPDGPAAEIDLRTLDVSYHALAAPRSLLSRVTDWLQPSAQAKGMSGPARQARWLGNGLIALTGTDETATRDASGQASFASDAAGLAIVDTRDWTVRMLDRGADSATIANDALLATGRSWSTASRETHGMGLAVYGSDRALRFRLWPGTSAWVEAVWAGRGYVEVSNTGNAKIFVVDLSSGRVVGQHTSPVPVPLLGDGPDF